MKKKLSLRKDIIARLGNQELNEIAGGVGSNPCIAISGLACDTIASIANCVTDGCFTAKCRTKIYPCPTTIN